MNGFRHLYPRYGRMIRFCVFWIDNDPDFVDFRQRQEFLQRMAQHRFSGNHLILLGNIPTTP